MLTPEERALVTDIGDKLLDLTPGGMTQSLRGIWITHKGCRPKSPKPQLSDRKSSVASRNCDAARPHETAACPRERCD